MVHTGTSAAPSPLRHEIREDSAPGAGNTSDRTNPEKAVAGDVAFAQESRMLVDHLKVKVSQRICQVSSFYLHLPKSDQNATLKVAEAYQQSAFVQKAWVLRSPLLPHNYRSSRLP